MQESGVKNSFSFSGRPHDNAVARLFDSFKKKRHTAESTPQK
jgi:hypothetical protein